MRALFSTATCLLALCLTLLNGCNDSVPQTSGLSPIGSPCSSPEDCASGACDSLCIEPVFPIADAGDNRIALVGVAARVSGSKSADPDGETLSYAWRFVTAPASSSVELNGRDTAEPTFVPDAAGIFELELVVTAADGRVSAPDSVVVFVFDTDGSFPKSEEGAPCSDDFECVTGNCQEAVCASNLPPIAKAGPPKAVGVATPVTLSAEGSTDPDGDPLSFQWQLTQVPGGSTAALTANDTQETRLTPDVPGVYAAMLTVNDGMLASSPVTVVVVADPLFDTEKRPDGASCDADEQCESLTCTDGVCVANLPPQADAGSIQYVEVGANVELSGALSLDPEGGPLSYSWTLFERPDDSNAALTTSTEMLTAFTADQAGVYLARLVVSDGTWPSGPAVVTIAAGLETPLLPVGEPCESNAQCETAFCSPDALCSINLAPTAVIEVPTFVDTGLNVQLSSALSSDPENDPLTAIWSIVELPYGSNASLTAETGEQTQFNADLPGIYVVRLVVSDGTFDSEPAYATVIVGAETPLKEDGDPCLTNAECASQKCEPTGVCGANQPPVADAGPGSAVPVGTSATLDGSDSSDAESAALTYTWSVKLAPVGATAAPAPPDAAMSTFTPDLPGIYVLELIVSDGTQESSPDLVTVVGLTTPGNQPDGAPCAVDGDCLSGYCLQETSLCGANAPPIAIAGPDQFVAPNTPTTLDGTSSYDPDGESVSHIWNIVGSPAGSLATLDDPTSSQPGLVPDVVGAYVVQLFVDDGYLLSVPTWTTVVVTEVSQGKGPGEPCGDDVECLSNTCIGGVCEDNQPPVAVVGGVIDGESGQTITMDGSASYDPESEPLSFSWSFIQLPNGATPPTLQNPTTANPTFVPDSPGPYLVRLVVSDGKLGSAPVYTTVSVVDELPPQPNGSPCFEDNDCTSNTCTGDTCAANDPPVADPGSDITSPVGVPATLDASGSSDPESANLLYEWSLLQSPSGSVATLTNATSVSPSLVPDVPGIYVVTLTVSDGNLTSLPASVAVVATSGAGSQPDGTGCSLDADCQSNTCDLSGTCAPNSPPVAFAGNEAFSPVGVTYTFDGSGSIDPESQPLNYSWSLVKSPVGSLATLLEGATATPSLTPDVAGTYVVGLVVDDGNLQSVPSFASLTATENMPIQPDGAPCNTDGDCVSNTCSAKICQVNVPPVGVVSGSANTPVGVTVTVDGTGSYDPESQPLQYQWTVISQPAGSAAALSNATAVAAQLTPDVVGSYMLRFIVNDGHLDSPPQYLVIVAKEGGNDQPDGQPCAAPEDCVSNTCQGGVCQPNAPPTAQAVTSTFTVVGISALLDGSSSSDPELQPLDYAWALRSKPTGSAASVVNASSALAELVPDVPGPYVIELTVYDGNLWSPPFYLSLSASSGAGNQPPGQPCAINEDCDSSTCVNLVCEANVPPVAAVSGSVSTPIGVQVTVDGTGSYDPESAPLLYRWDIVSQPSTSIAALANATAVAAQLQPDVAGSYMLSLTVNDGYVDSPPQYLVVTAFIGANNQLDGQPCGGDGDCVSNTCTVGFCEPNQRPIADAGQPLILPVGVPALFDGSNSSDPESALLDYQWTVLERPIGSAAMLSAATTATPSLMTDVPGTYVVELVVNDGKRLSLPDFVTVSATDGGGNQPDGSTCSQHEDCISKTCIGDICQSNTPPQAIVNGNSFVPVNVTATLDGTPSFDAETGSLSHTWRIAELPAASNATIADPTAPVATFVPDVEGLFVAELIVSDGYLQSPPAFLPIIATIGSGQQISGKLCDINEDCQTKTCIGGTCQTNLPPDASAIGGGKTPVGVAVAVLGGGSYDIDGNPITYQWTLVQAPATSTANLANPTNVDATLTPDVEGTYLVQLVVNDGYLESAPAFITVTALANSGDQAPGEPCANDGDCQSLTCNGGVCQANAPPLASAGSDVQIPVGVTTTLDGSGSNDPENATLGFDWRLASAPTGSSAMLVNGNTVSPTFTPDVAGAYAIELVVTDGKLLSPPDLLTVLAMAPTNSEPTGAPCATDGDCVSNTCTGGTCQNNQQPLANAGPDLTLPVGVMATLDGSGSSDPESAQLTYIWTLIERPSNATADVSPGTPPSAELVPDVPGVYVVELRVNDGKRDSVPDLVTVQAFDSDNSQPDGQPCAVDEDCISNTCVGLVCAPNAPPVADAGDPMITPVNVAVSLDGSQSSDPESAALTYTWSVVSGPIGSNANLNDPNLQAPTFTPDLPGTFVFKLEVSDGKLSSAPSYTSLQSGVAPGTQGNGAGCGVDADCASRTCVGNTCQANSPPIADAGPAQAVAHKTTVQLDGTNSSDPEFQPLQYTWLILDAPLGSSATLTGEATATPTFFTDEVGFYNVELRVYDGHLWSPPEVVTVSAGVGTVLFGLGDACAQHWECESFYCNNNVCSFNSAPTAQAGAPQVVNVGATVTLDGSTSLDPEGQPLGYEWTLSPAPGSSANLSTPAEAVTTFTADVPGTYVANLQTSDGKYVSQSNTLVIAETPSGGLADGTPCTADFDCDSGWCLSTCQPNDPPTASISSVAFARVGETVVIDWTASTDPDVQPLFFTWNLVAQPPSSTAFIASVSAASTTFVPDLPGLYTVSLRTSDGYLWSTPATFDIQVAPNDAPYAAVGVALPPSDPTGGTIFLDGTVSTDPDGDGLSHSWGLISRPEGSSATLTDTGGGFAEVVADVSGTYVIELTVTDGIFANTTAVAAKVTYPGEPKAIIQGTGKASTTCIAQFDGSASVDPDGSIIGYTWNVVQQPAGATGTFKDATAMQPGFIGDIPGIYVVGLKVTDNAGNVSALTTYTVSVIDPLFNRQNWKTWITGGTSLWYRESRGYRRYTFVDQGNGSYDVMREDYHWTSDDTWPASPNAPPGPNAVFDYNTRWVDGEGAYLSAGPLDALAWRQCVTAEPFFATGDLGGGQAWHINQEVIAVPAVAQNAVLSWPGTLQYAQTSFFTGGPSTDFNFFFYWSHPDLGNVREVHEDGTNIEELVYHTALPGSFSGPPSQQVEIPNVTMTVDGSDADWSTVPLVWDDPSGDTLGIVGNGYDLRGLGISVDATNVYMYIPFYDPPANPAQEYRVYVQSHDDFTSLPGDYQIRLVYNSGLGNWEIVRSQQGASGSEAPSGVATWAETPSGFELQIPRSSTNSTGLTLYDMLVDGFVYVDNGVSGLNTTDLMAPPITLVDQF